MGIFGKSNKKSKPVSGTTVISEGTVIKGGIDTKGSVFIDGQFEGIIVAAKSVTIGKTGEVLGEIRTKTLTVSGFIDGIFDAHSVNILSEGKIIGKMKYDDLIIEHNGVFEGEGKRNNSTLNSKYNSLSIDSEQQIEF